MTAFYCRGLQVTFGCTRRDSPTVIELVESVYLTTSSKPFYRPLLPIPLVNSILSGETIKAKGGLTKVEEKVRYFVFFVHPLSSVFPWRRELPCLV